MSNRTPQELAGLDEIRPLHARSAGQALKESEPDFETLANLVPQLVWMCGPDGLNFYFNQRWVAYTGLTLEESYGTGWITPFHPDHKQAARDAWNHATKTGEKYSIESLLRGADQVYRWFLIVGEPLKDAAGKVVRWFGTCTDIEQQKLAEESLRKSEERFRALATATSDMLYRMGPDAREMRQLQGRGLVADLETPSENWLQKFVHPDDHARTMAAVDEALRNKTSFELEHRILGDDGSTGWVLSRAVPLQDANGNIIEWFGAASEISERKMAEAALLRQAALLDLAHDAIIVRGEKDKITFWSHGAEATYGFTREEAMGQVTHQLLKTQFPEPLAEISLGVRNNDRWEGELIHTRKDGQTITVASRWAVERDPAGREVAIMEVNRDISERKQMEQGLRESRDRLALAQQIAHAGSFDLDLKTQVVVWSEELQELYGIGPGTPHVGMDEWTQWILSEDRERVLSELAIGLETGEVTSQFRIRRRDSGEVRWIDGRGRVLRDEHGAPTRMVGFSIDITEQKQAEEELRQSAARERARSTELQALMDAVPGAIFITHDPDCRRIYGNRATHQLLRREPGDNLSLSAPKLEKPNNFRVMRNGIEIPPQDLPVQIAARTGEAVENAELHLVFDDGYSPTWLGGAAPMIDENGRPAGAIGVFVDITERKRTEQALQDSEERMRLAQEAAGIGYFDWNLVTNETTWSESLRRMMGRAPDSTFGLWDKIRHVHPDDQPAFDAQLNNALDGKSASINISYRSTTPAGLPCWRLCAAKVYPDEKGTPIRLLGIIVDITAHKQAEKAQQIEHELKHLEAGIRTLTDGVLVADLTGKLLSVNPAAMRIFGFESHESAPQNFQEFFALFEVTQLNGALVPAEDWPAARALRGETTLGREFRSRNRKTNHSWVASYGCAPVRDETGAIIMIVLGVHDTTAERIATEQVQRTNAALHALSGKLLHLQDDERKRIARELHDGVVQTLSAAVMHLTVLSDSISHQQRGPDLHLLTKGLGLIEQSAKELRTMSYLLHPPVLEELGLAPALRSWIDGFSERTGIPVDISIPAKIDRLAPQIETALFRITQEALGNVHRHAESASASVVLQFTTEVIHLEIADDGKGFEASSSTIGQGQLKSGLGLLSMRERAAQLGGILVVESRPGKTAIRARLPRSPHGD